MKSGLKVKRRRKKKGKIKRKKLQNFFCLDASTWRDEMPLIKVAYFMLNFLNLRGFLSNLFFCSSIQPQHAVNLLNGSGLPDSEISSNLF